MLTRLRLSYGIREMVYWSLLFFLPHYNLIFSNVQLKPLPGAVVISCKFQQHLSCCGLLGLHVRPFILELKNLVFIYTKEIKTTD